MIEVGEATATLTASYLTDALDDLAGAVVALLRGDEQSTAIFAEEPGEYRWQFVRKGLEGIEIRIHFVGHSTVSPLRTAAAAVLYGLQSLLGEYGVAEYKEHWVLHDFPERRIDALTELLT